jgi:hypothetical protein
MVINNILSCGEPGYTPGPNKFQQDGVLNHVDTPQFLQKPAALAHKNLKLPRRNSNVWNLPALSAVQHHHGHPLCTWFPRKMGLGGLVVITVTLI